MMSTIERFPAACRKNIRRLVNRLSTDCDTAYAMMLLTAALMDMTPEDPKVAEIILNDCGLDIGDCA